MSSISQRHLPFDELRGLPRTVQLKDGRIIDIAHDRFWITNRPDSGRTCLFDWQCFETILHDGRFSERAIRVSELYIVHRLMTMGITTVYTEYGFLKDLGRFLAEYGSNVLERNLSLTPFEWSDVNEYFFREFKNLYALSSPGRFKYITFLKTLYRWGVAFQLSEFDSNMLPVLTTIGVPDNPSGDSVRYRHPTRGPFSPKERRLIWEAIKHGYGTVIRQTSIDTRRVILTETS